MSGAAFIFGFVFILEDTLMDKDSETKGVLLWGDLDQYHTVHGSSEELMNHCLEQINWFLCAS